MRYTGKNIMPLLMALLVLGGCQSVESLSIDYMLPADVSFPASLKRVAVVNNMPDTPDNQMPDEDRSGDKEKKEGEAVRFVKYYNGDASIATEALAEAIANENYFDEVVICDSALRAHDLTPRETSLSGEEVSALVRDLRVDLLVALENVQIRSVRKAGFSPYYNAYLGTTDVKVWPTVRLYVPNRKGPLLTVNAPDSIYWEELGGNLAYVQSRLIGDKELVRQASEFAGTLSVKHLLPSWTTAMRYYFAGGSVNMRDAAVSVRERDWETAIGLWQEAYRQKKGKKKMQAAHNLALGYEMQDSIDLALEWELKAQALARAIDRVDERREAGEVNAEEVPNYVFTTLYVTELEKRKAGMPRLNIQMQRFEDDF